MSLTRDLHCLVDQLSRDGPVEMTNVKLGRSRADGCRSVVRHLPKGDVGLRLRR